VSAAGGCRGGKRGRTGVRTIGGGEDGEHAVADQLEHVAALPVDSETMTSA